MADTRPQNFISGSWVGGLLSLLFWAMVCCWYVGCREAAGPKAGSNLGIDSLESIVEPLDTFTLSTDSLMALAEHLQKEDKGGQALVFLNLVAQREASSEASQLPDAYWSLMGLVHQQSRQYDSALKYFRIDSVLLGSYPNAYPVRWGTALSNLIVCYARVAQFDQAFEVGKVLEAFIETAGEKMPLLNRAGCLNAIAIAYGRLPGDAKLKVIQLNRDAIKLIHQISPTPYDELVPAYTNLAGQLGRILNQPDSQLHYLHTAAKFAAIAYDDATHANYREVVKRLGTYFFSQEQFDSAFQYYYEALELGYAANDSAYIASVSGNLGAALGNLGRNEEGLVYINQALTIQESIFGSASGNLAFGWNYLAGILGQVGDFEQAYLYSQKSLSAFIETYGHRNLTTGLQFYNHGLFCLRLGRTSEARQRYVEALDIFTSELPPNHPRMALPLYGIGSVFQKLNETDSALFYFDKARKIYTNNNDLFSQSRIASVYSSYAFLYARQNRWDSAVHYQRKAIQAYEKIEGNASSISIKQVHLLGEYFFRQGSYDSASLYAGVGLAKLFPDSAVLNPQNLDQLPKPTSRWGFIRLLKLKGDLAREGWKKGNRRDYPEEAMAYYTKALAEMDDMRNLPFSDTYKALYQQSARPVIEAALDMLFQLDQAASDPHLLEEAWQLVERNKALALLRGIKHLYGLQYADFPDSLLHRERNLKADIDYLDQKWTEARTKGDSLKSSQYLFTLTAKQDSFHELRTRIANSYPRYHALKYANTPVELSTVQARLLGARDNIINYFWGKDHLYVIAAETDQAMWYRVELDSTQLEENLNKLLAGLQQPGPLEDFQQQSQTLSRSLLAPITFLEAGEGIRIIPDGLLCYLPFSVLTAAADEENDAVTDFLVQKHPISYLYSGTWWAELSQFSRPSRHNGKLLGVAPFVEGLGADSLEEARDRGRLLSLPGAHQELLNISRRYPSTLMMEGTKADFVAAAETYQIIHIASHATADKQQPHRSAILFHDDKDTLAVSDSTRLYARELYGMELSADLAVLSACETGIGPLQAGEGLMSLGRAFSYAGVPSLVHSLWKIDDKSSAEVMSAFYEGLKEGLGKDQALRDAKVAYFKDVSLEQRHPYYWAGLILYGEATPLSSRDHAWLYWVIGLMLILGGVSITFWRRRKSV